MLVVVLLLMVFWPAGASAHIKSDQTQFPDIDVSAARFDIMLMVAAGIIPETPVFEPDRPLSRKDLAAWLTLGHGLMEGGENPDIDILAMAALNAGLIDSIEGEATFGDLSALFFDSLAAGERADETPTRAEAASFLADHETLEVSGSTLFERAGLIEGPRGPITVESRPTADGDSAYIVTVGETSLPLYAHGRVARGPTDLLAWEGRTVSRSFIREMGDLRLWTYLEAEPLELVAQSSEPVEQAGPAERSGSQTLPILAALVGAIVVLGLVLFFRGRRAG